MKVYELKLKVYLLENILYKEIYEKIAVFIDKGLCMVDNFEKFHNENTYKNYCFSTFFPIEKDKIYKKDNIYNITFRTIDEDTAKYVFENMQNLCSDEIKMLTIDIKEIRMRPIEKLYSISPAVLKTDKGYWKNILTDDEFEKRVKVNLIKKHNNFTSEKINEKFDLSIGIEFKNIKPLTVNYKNIKILGDKIELYISGDEQAQKLAFMALGTGILEMNARGAGYVKAKFY